MTEELQPTPADSGHGQHPNQVEPPPADTGRELTRTAVSATMHCLTGCAIGEVLGMILARHGGGGPTRRALRSHCCWPSSLATC